MPENAESLILPCDVSNSAQRAPRVAAGTLSLQQTLGSRGRGPTEYAEVYGTLGRDGRGDTQPQQGIGTDLPPLYSITEELND